MTATLASPAEALAARRKFYLAPTSEKVTVDGCTDEMGVGYVTPRTHAGAKYPASYVVWFGKAAKPSAHYAAKSMEEAKVAVEKSLKDAALVAAAKAATKAKKAEDRKTWDAAKTLPVGSVLYHSWGWEQTNIDFFKVVAVVSRTVVEVVAIGATRVANSGNSNGMSDTVVADPDTVREGDKLIRMRLVGPVTTAVPGCGGYTFGGHATKYDGRPLYRSWYA